MMYSAHMGVIPAALADLTSPATNAQNQVAGPFMAAIPQRPSTAWSAYNYAPNTSAGTFAITAAGDGVTVSVP
jgi:hypothetical protein